MLPLHTIGLSEKLIASADDKAKGKPRKRQIQYTDSHTLAIWYSSKNEERISHTEENKLILVDFLGSNPAMDTIECNLTSYNT